MSTKTNKRCCFFKDKLGLKPNLPMTRAYLQISKLSRTVSKKRQHIGSQSEYKKERCSLFILTRIVLCAYYRSAVTGFQAWTLGRVLQDWLAIYTEREHTTPDTHVE